jgi:hypothetical protein
LNKHLGIPTEKIVIYAGLSKDQLLDKVKEANGGSEFDFIFDLVGGKKTNNGQIFPIVLIAESTNIFIGALNFDGHIVSIVAENSGEC